MKKSRNKLYHNQYRQLFYNHEEKRLFIYWYGKVPEEEQYKNIDYLNELIKIYDIEHVEVYTKKAKFLSLRPTRLFIEKTLKRIFEQGGKTFTLFQKPIKNQQFFMNAYLTAIRSLGINMQFKMVTV